MFRIKFDASNAHAVREMTVLTVNICFAKMIYVKICIRCRFAFCISIMRADRRNGGWIVFHRLPQE